MLQRNMRLKAQIGTVTSVAAMLLIGGDSLAEESLNSGARRLPGCRSAISGEAARDQREAMSQGLCVGQIVALFATSDLPGMDKTYSFCKPSGATIAQAIKIVVKSTNDAPERNSTDFVVLAIDALATAWPCKRKSPSN
jgi:hypothetical protein